MKTIIAGSRNILDYEFVRNSIIDSKIKITEIVSGCARGVDKLGERYAIENNILLKYFPANWDFYGKQAGFIRNEEMAKYSECLIAIWDGISRGTKNMIDLAKHYGLDVRVYTYSINTDG